MGPSDELLRRAVEAAKQVAPTRTATRTAVLRALRARQPERPSPWRRLAFTGALAATAAALVLAQTRAPEPRRAGLLTAPRSSQAQVSPLVELLPAEGARYTVEQADDSTTRVRVTGGSVAFHLAHGARPHRLVVLAGELAVEAIGTVFTVGLDGERPFVTVDDGRIRARANGREALVDAGWRWDVGASVEPHPIDRQLLGQLGVGPSTATEPEPQRKPARPAPDPVSAAAPAQAAPSEQWRRARLLRGAGQLEAAVALLSKLEASGDPTWAPIALLERARIKRTLGDAAGAQGDAEAFLLRYPRHELLPEARALADSARAPLRR